MKSKHLTGEAFDIAVLLNGKISWKANDYEPYGKIGKDLGLLWGGDAWLPKFIDAPHFEFKRGT